MVSKKVSLLLEKAIRAESSSELEDAEGLFNDALCLCLNSDEPAGIGQCYTMLAAFLLRRGRIDEAEALAKIARLLKPQECEVTVLPEAVEYPRKAAV